MDLSERVQLQLGKLMVENAALAAKVEELIKELETKKSEDGKSSKHS